MSGQWLLIRHAQEYGLLTPGCLAGLRTLIRRARGEVQAMALSALTVLQGSRCERLLIELLESPAFRHKYTALWAIEKHGSIASVPAVAAFVKRAVLKRPRCSDRESDLAIACRFLLRHIDESDAVEPAFAAVVRHWHKLNFEEAQHIHFAVRWIGVRTLGPIKSRREAWGDGRTTVQMPGGSRRLYEVWASADE